MYAVTVRRSLIAQHYLTVPDPGPEGELHSHRFEIELRLSGPELNEYGYLVDIDEVKAALDGIEARYADETLNAMPAFEGLNPSVEQFARIVAERLRADAGLSNPERLRVRIWEDGEAAAAYETPLD